MPDITPGLLFTSGQLNVGHVELNTATAGAINTTFHTGKSSVAANPNTGANEVMVYDSGAAAWKKGSLAALFFDHTALLSARTAKTVPKSADTVLLSDSDAAGALKQIALANLVFNGPAHALARETDKIPILDPLSPTFDSITIANLITTPANVSSIDGLEQIPVITNAGALRKLKLANIASAATALVAVAGGEILPIIVGGALKRVGFGELIDLQTLLSAPTGGMFMLVGNGPVTTRKMALTTMKTFAQAGYALYRDEKAQNTVGGTLTAGSWGTRTLNTESVDNIVGGASVAANQVTLPAGTFRFRGAAPFYRVGACQVRLQNITDATTAALGTVRNSGNSGTGAVVQCEVSGRFTIAAPKAFELQYQIGASVGTSDGGPVGNFATEVYSFLEFWQED